MDAYEHEGKALRYMTVHPDGYEPSKDYPMVILLHGFGSHMGALAGLAPAIDSRGYVYACPNAPLAFNIGGGVMGYGWMTPMGMGNPSEEQEAVNLVAGFCDEVMAQYRVRPGNVVLGGFSQGGGMTYRCGLPRPDLFSGLFALSGFLRDPAKSGPALPPQRAQPIFIAHGMNDPMITLEHARETKDFLESQGYKPLYKEYPMAHEVSQDVLDDLVPWLHRVLPPAA